MARTTYGVNDAETVKKWSRKLFREALKATWLYKFMGRGSDSVIQIKDDDLKDAGDRVRFTLRMQLTGAGVAGDATLEGKEEALSTFTDNLLIDQLRHATRSGGRMSEQRVPFDIREENRLALTDWWADRIDFWGFNALAGNTAETDLKYTGFNATTAPNADAFVFEQATTTMEASLTAASTTTLVMIDKAIERAKTNTPPVRPVMVGGTPYYVMFLHPFQVFDMRRDTSTAGWYDIQKAVLTARGNVDNPIFTGALGIYNNTVLHESTRVPTITANVRRAIFCGAQSGLVAFSKLHSPTRMTWTEELFDYGNQLGVEAGMIAGLKKAVFNSLDFGVIAASSYAVAH